LKLTFVLVHGSMHDGSCWDQVIAELNRQGHVAYAPTMAGHGEDAGNFFTQADCVESVVDYILERYGEGRLMPEPGTADSARYRQWCWFAEATFARPLGEIVNHRRVAPGGETVDFVIEDCRARARLCLDALEGALADADYLVANTFGAADIMSGYTLNLAAGFGVLTDDHPKTVAYFERLAGRPGFQVARDAG